MSGMNLFYLLLFFCMVFAAAILVLYWLAPSPVQQRLQQISGAAPSAQPAQGDGWLMRMARLSRPLAKLSQPEEGAKASLRVRFMNAGLRDEHAPVIYFGAKTLLALAMPGLAWLMITLGAGELDHGVMLLALVASAASGFYLPNAMLARLVEKRQRAIIDHFPDAMDLITVCIEAGLAIDAAIARVADEMMATARVLGEELRMVTLELRAGSSKEDALRNFATRTGVEDVERLATLLIQAERFGTSIGQALRVHSEGLRTKRRQRAEEAAAKIALKLLFPLIFCIFPALLVVLLGPAAIQVYRVLLPSIGG